MSPYRAMLLARARALADLASERDESELLRAVVWLELRASAHACTGLLERIAVQWLLLADHPEVRTQHGLGRRYAERAWRWADAALHGAASSGSALERACDA
ncbi:MAG TPA: hypothetical protein VFT98_12265 [Myxococcota bacterium]|nr:hypothetical protein [Myxococcota bacterium]